MNTTSNSLWVGYALLSAVFAALTSILAKLGISGIDSNLGHRDSDGGGAGDGMGNRFYDRSQQAAAEYRRALLDFFDSFRNRDRTVLAVLLPCAPAGRCQQGGAD